VKNSSRATEDVESSVVDLGEVLSPRISTSIYVCREHMQQLCYFVKDNREHSANTDRIVTRSARGLRAAQCTTGVQTPPTTQ
jgi:hypothetical protein